MYFLGLFSYLLQDFHFLELMLVDWMIIYHVMIEILLLIHYLYLKKQNIRSILSKILLLTCHQQLSILIHNFLVVIIPIYVLRYLIHYHIFLLHHQHDHELFLKRKNNFLSSKAKIISIYLP